MKIVGLDISLTSTGLVVLEDGVMIFNKAIKSKNEGKTVEERLNRISEIIDELKANIHNKNIDVIVIEGYSFGSRVGMAYTIGELGGIARWEFRGYKMFEIAPTQLKKFITGKGKCDKNLILKEVYKRYNVDFDSDDIADAFALAMIYWTLHCIENNIECKLTKPQKEVIGLMRKEGNK